MKIGPHAELAETQKSIIAIDYDVRDGMAKTSVLRAIICYTLRRLGLDTDPVARQPQDQQTVLLNREILDENH